MGARWQTRRWPCRVAVARTGGLGRACIPGRDSSRISAARVMVELDDVGRRAGSGVGSRSAVDVAVAQELPYDVVGVALLIDRLQKEVTGEAQHGHCARASGSAAA